MKEGGWGGGEADFFHADKQTFPKVETINHARP